MLCTRGFHRTTQARTHPHKASGAGFGITQHGDPVGRQVIDLAGILEHDRHYIVVRQAFEQPF